MKRICLLIISLILGGLITVSGPDAEAGFEGTFNTFYGMGAGASTTGDDAADTFIGAGAGYSNTTGYGNTFLGYRAGSSNTEGYHNTFLGYYAGYSNIFEP